MFSDGGGGGGRGREGIILYRIDSKCIDVCISKNRGVQLPYNSHHRITAGLITENIPTKI